MRRVAALLVLFALVMLVSACAPTQFITVRTTIPPEKDVPLHIKNIAVLDFTGHQAGGDVVSVKLEQELLNNQHYKVIERSEIAGIINEKNFQETDLVESNPEFLAAMKIKAIQALITGSVATFHSATDNGVDTRTERYIKTRRRVGTRKDGTPIMEPVWDTRLIPEPWTRRQGNCNATFKMVDVNTGQIIASVSKGGASSSGKVKGNAPLPTDSEVLERAAMDAVVQFIKDISTWTEVAKFRLKGAKNCATGNNFAANGLYDKAEEQYRMAATIPGNYGAVYNLGLALEAQGRYAEAEEAYDQALAMAPSDREVMDAINRVKQKKVYEVRLRKLRGEE